MTDITTTPPAVAEAPGPATTPAPGYSDLQKAIFAAIREELDLDVTDAEIDEDLRELNKLIVPRSDDPAQPLFSFEVGQPYPSLPGSKIIALFLQDVGDSPMPGEVRIYVEPALPLGGVKDHLCYTLNRTTLGMTREVMTRAKFAKEIGIEHAELLDPGDDEEDDEEEEDEENEEAPVCSVDDCDADVTLVCDCVTCAATPIADRAFAVCADAKHLEQAGQSHLKEVKRAPKWIKLPAVATDN